MSAVTVPVQQRNFTIIQFWVNTPETNDAKTRNNEKNPNYLCVQVWFNRTSKGNWQPSVKVTAGEKTPSTHKTTNQDRHGAVNWLRNLLENLPSNHTELTGYEGRASNSDGPFILVTKITRGTGSPEFTEEKFATRAELEIHCTSLLRGLPNIIPEMRGELPQPEDEEPDTISFNDEVVGEIAGMEDDNPPDDEPTVDMPQAA